MINITEQQNRYRMLLGGSGGSNPAYNAVNKNLDHAKGSNSLLNARVEKITAIPYASIYSDSVGLFGAENVFIKVELDIKNATTYFNDVVLVGDYLEGTISGGLEVTDQYWESAIIDYNDDYHIENNYEPVALTSEIQFIPQGLVRIDLENLKTGNKYIDAWFDVRLYDKNRKEHNFDVMYLGVKDHFYIGFHARNTKRLPYNVRMTVGSELVSGYELSNEQRKYLVS